MSRDYYKDFKSEVDMLQGNINRMYLEQTVEDINFQFEFAKIRLQRLYDIVIDKFLNGGVSDEQ